MAPTLARPIAAPPPAAVPEHLSALHDAALAEFSGGRFKSALPLLARLALALPASHGLRGVVRASLARTYLALGDLPAAERELRHALEADGDGPAFRQLGRMIAEARRGQCQGN
ncbi:MAG: tetratricopeptide repeat protein [Polyangiaceae bacterium]